jgi:phosphate transport system permease protein
MQTAVIFAAILALTLISFTIGRRRAIVSVGGATAKLHSRPGHYGWYVVLWTAVPAFAVMVLWMLVQPLVLTQLMEPGVPPAVRELSSDQQSLVYNRIRRIVQELAPLGFRQLREVAAASGSLDQVQALLGQPGFEGLKARWPVFQIRSPDQLYLLKLAAERALQQKFGGYAMPVAALLAAAAGFVFGRRRVMPAFRARNKVESAVKLMLMLSSTVAILTTVGIVLSVLFESIKFFSIVNPADFLLGTTWDPRFTAVGREGSEHAQFGLLPLLWGTLFITAIAMAIAIPVGLLSAIYLSEYASPRVRAVVKPLLEILAGIPTVVYGFFALITIGPFIRDVGETLGIGSDARSALAAGICMGIMIIPFISSLSDDMLSAVPQSLRQGSYGLGATKSETIKKVLLRAALPGIVGSVLLAVSRAVGETMIVVMAAGGVARLTLNPFEAVTTITVTIKNQLTGDLEFTSPQTMVAFALGLTLFVITLALNILALQVVRKYREQYE